MDHISWSLTNLYLSTILIIVAPVAPNVDLVLFIGIKLIMKFFMNVPCSYKYFTYASIV